MAIIRPATIADAEGIAHVDVETWRATYPGILPDQLLVGMSPARRAQFWTRFISRRAEDTLIAVDDAGTIIGFGSCGPQRDSDLPYFAEIFTLYVTPDWQGVGLGRALLLAQFARLARSGLTSAVVWVLSDNVSRFFYERLGGRLVARQQLELGRKPVGSLAYGWSDLSEVLSKSGQAQSRIG